MSNTLYDEFGLKLYLNTRNAEEILKDIFSLDLQTFGFKGYNFAIKLSIEERLAAKIRSSGEYIHCHPSFKKWLLDIFPNFLPTAKAKTGTDLLLILRSKCTKFPYPELKHRSRPTHIATSNVKQYENDINDITWTTTNLVGNPLDYHAMIPLIRFMKSWNHKVLYLFVEGKVVNLAKYFVGLPYVDREKEDKSTVDSYTYLYKIGVDDLQRYLKSMGNGQGQPSQISSTPTVITVRKNSHNQWSNPKSVIVDQQHTVNGSHSIITSGQDEISREAGQSLLKKGPSKVWMNARDIVRAPLVAMNYSQGFVQSNIPDQTVGSIVTGEVQQQAPATRVISYPINDRHLSYTQPGTRTIVQSPASFSTLHGSVLNLEQDVQATEVSLSQMNGAQFLLPEGHSILLPSSCGTKFIQASVIAHQPDGTLIASTQEQNRKGGSVALHKQGYVGCHGAKNFTENSTKASTSGVKLQDNSRRTSTTTIKLQEKPTTASTSGIKLQDKPTSASTTALKLPTSADHSIGSFISQNEMGGFSNILVTLDKSGNIIQCQPLSCEDGHLTLSQIVTVQKNNSTEQNVVAAPSNEVKCTTSVGGNLNTSDEIGKELSYPDYVPEVTDTIQSTSNEDKTAHSVLVDSNRLEDNRKEKGSGEYDDHDHVIDRNSSTPNTIITSPENEEHRIPPCSSDVTIEAGKKNTNFTNGSEDVALKTTSNEEKMVKAVVPEDDDVSINVRNVEKKKMEINFQKTLDKLRQKLNARSKKENSKQEMVLDKEQTKSELCGKEYKVFHEDFSELETTDHEIIGDYKFSADDEYENTQDEEKEIDHEEVVETTISNEKNILKRRHQDNLFELFLNVKGCEGTMTNEEDVRSQNGKGEKENFGLSADHVPITKDTNNSKDSLMTNDMKINKDVEIATDTNITNDLEMRKDMKNPKDGIITKDMNNPKDDIITKDTKIPKDVEVTSDMKNMKNVQLTNDIKNPKVGVSTKDVKMSTDTNITNHLEMTKDMKNPKHGLITKDINNHKDGIMTKDMNNPKDGPITKDMNNPKDGTMRKDMNNPKDGVMTKNTNNPKDGTITKERKNPNDCPTTQDTKIDSKKDEPESEIEQNTCEIEKKKYMKK